MAEYVRTRNALAQTGDLTYPEEFSRYRRLWASVMHQGLIDAAVAFRKAMNLGHSPSRYQPYNWLHDEQDRPGSFVWICRVLDIRPDRARSGWRMKVRELAEKGKEKDLD